MTTPVSDLHQQIMNLPCHNLRLRDEYKEGFTHGHKAARHAAAQLVAASPAAAAQQQQRGEDPQEEHSGILDLMGQCKCARCKPVHLAVNDAEQDFRDERALSDAAPVAWVCRYKPDGKWMLFDVRPLVKDSVMECLPVTRPTDLPAVFDELIAFEDTSEVQPRFSDAVRIALAAKNRTTVAASPAAAAWNPTDDELAAIYKRANGEDTGKAKPLFTANIFKAMRAMLASSPVAPVGAPTKAARDVLAERERQKSVEGWTPEHDDEHGDGSMSIAAACYALWDRMGVQVDTVNVGNLWRWTGWGESWFKPKDPRRNLIRAGALILAEIERLDRQGCELATDATKQQREHSVHLAASDAGQDFRAASALSTPVDTNKCLPNGVMFDAFGNTRVRYVRVIHDGTTCVVPPQEVESLVDAERPDDYRTEYVYLSKEEFDGLPEFDGF